MDVEFMICGTEQEVCQRWWLIRRGDISLKDAARNLGLIESALESAKIAPVAGGRQLAQTEQGGRIVPANVMRTHGVDVPVLLRFIESAKPRRCLLEASAEGYGTASVAEIRARDPDEGAWYCRNEFQIHAAYASTDNTSIVLGLSGYCDSVSTYTLDLKAAATMLRRAKKRN
jgi:hypothetical protein